jgi:diguanylate cyclase (GGDEF)-like protein
MSLTAERAERGAQEFAPLRAPEVAAEAPGKAYALTVAVAAIALVWWTTTSYPLHPAIAMHWDGVDRSAAILVGVGYWTLFGMLGALRSRELESGAVLTFHMPFVVAGTILGGPVVGGWMGLLSQFERREFTAVPWYGMLGNHAIIAIAAIAAGAAGDGVAILAASTGVEPGAAQFASALAVAAVFTIVNVAMVLPVAAMRREVGVFQVLRSYDRIFSATIVAEGILAWLMALVYVGVGWWAPIACVILVLVIWDRDDWWERGHRDHMTGLLNNLGFKPRLETAVREARNGGRLHALLMLDLDGFGGLNKAHGEAVGDEVIIAVAGRLRSSVRETDVVGRQHHAGDEFSVLLLNVPDESIGVALATRIRARICQPIVSRTTDKVVSVGVSIGIVFLGPGVSSSEEAASRADRRMQFAKKHEIGILAEDPPDGEIDAGEHAAD